MAHPLPDGAPHISEEEESDNINFGNENADRQQSKKVNSKLEKTKAQLSQLLDIGFVIFITHKLEKLLQDLLVDVIMWCPGYLQYLFEKYPFRVFDLKKVFKYEFDQLKEILTSHEVFLSVRNNSGYLDEKEWRSMKHYLEFDFWKQYCQVKIVDCIERRRLTYDMYRKLVNKGFDIFVVSEASKEIERISNKLQDLNLPEIEKRTDDGAMTEMKKELDGILDVFTITLGQLIYEVQTCNKHLTNSCELLQHKTVKYKAYAQHWHRTVTDVDRKFTEFKVKKGQYDKDTLYERMREILRIRNEMSHHGESRPCLSFVDSKGERDDGKRDELKEYYDWITTSALTTSFSKVNTLTYSVLSKLTRQKPENETAYDVVDLSELDATTQEIQRERTEELLAEEKKRRTDLEGKLCTSCKHRLLMKASDSEQEITAEEEMTLPETTDNHTSKVNTPMAAGSGISYVLYEANEEAFEEISDNSDESLNKNQEIAALKRTGSRGYFATTKYLPYTCIIIALIILILSIILKYNLA